VRRHARLFRLIIIGLWFLELTVAASILSAAPAASSGDATRLVVVGAWTICAILAVVIGVSKGVSAPRAVLGGLIGGPLAVVLYLMVTPETVPR
jgi:choline-glycine betaine transporter